MPTAILEQALHSSAAPAALSALAGPPEGPRAHAGTRARGTARGDFLATRLHRFNYYEMHLSLKPKGVDGRYTNG